MLAASVALAVPFAVVACGGGSDVPDAGPSGTDGAPPDPTVFISQTTDFSGFCNWPHALAVAPAGASDGLHPDAGLTAYWNHPPPHGTDQFPVGTMILKETNETDPSKRIVFAMVKRQARGTGYNPGGADGWEWWSLQDNGDCTVSRLWRGQFAPAGESYAMMPAGDCNGCHVGASGNDYVWDEALQLSHF
jgi:hypothetical protein